MEIVIKGIDKPSVLAALYNRAKPLGMGFLHYTPEPMTRTEAAELLKKFDYFDYLKGRVMKVDLRGDAIETRLYDRDNGERAAMRALIDAGLIPIAATVE